MGLGVGWGGGGGGTRQSVSIILSDTRKKWGGGGGDNVRDTAKDERGPSSIRRTLEPFQRQRWKTSERQGRAQMDFSERIDTILK